MTQTLKLYSSSVLKVQLGNLFLITFLAIVQFLSCTHCKFSGFFSSITLVIDALEI